MDTCSEVKQFIEIFKTGCSEIGVPPEVALTVMLFETGSSLSAWYTSGGEAFGLLQWTINGCEPIAVQKAIGIPNPTEASKTACYTKMKSLNRLQQLAGWKAYYKYWYVQNAKQWAGISDPYLKHYVLTLAPNGGPNYKDGNGVTAKSLTSGTGAAGRNFAALKKLAADMLAGNVAIPGEDSTIQRVVGYNALAVYLKKVGSCKVASGGQTPGNPVPGAPVPGNPVPEGSDKKKSIEDILPVKMSISIPEYPRLVGLKAGDVIVLPQTSQLRDWLITRVERTFTAGLNTLVISCNRPLDPKPFIQAEALTGFPNNIMAHYWGGPG